MPNETTTHFSARRRLIVAAISACFASSPAWANPTGHQVVNGAVSFNQAGKLLSVTNSNGAIINWSSFSIAKGETTRFNQASAASSVLNRVVANDPSVLLGTLSSNGKVWLVNPAGILVGQGARIDVAGFIASTLNVRNEDFLAGRLNFGATHNAGKIENYGRITTPSGGSVYLIAPNIENHGIINAPNGEVILAAGQTAQLIDTGTPGVKVDISGVEGNVTNLGEIVAEAGRIGMAGVLVKNSGMLNASSVIKEGGRIFLKASQDAYVDGAGRILATGTKGGSIEVLGKRVVVMDQAQLDASGNTGGGTVLVGGDYQGKNPEVQNSSVTYFGSQASLKADALQNGDGGKVIVWADDSTRAFGTISARGGSEGGNGGFVETSGHYLDVAGARVNAGAPNGQAGHWLLDPWDLTISNSASANPSVLTAGVFDAAGTGSNVNSADVQSTLNGGTDVVITTGSGGSEAGNITVSGTSDPGGAVNIVKSAGGDRSLTLKAAGSIVMNSGAGISSTSGKLNFTLNADWDGSGGGAIKMGSGSSLASKGGNIKLGGGTAGDGTGHAIGNATYINGIYLTGATLEAGGGNIALNGTGFAGTSFASGVYVTDSSVIQTSGAGTITLNGTGGAGTDNNYGVVLGTSAALSSVNGAISITGLAVGSGGSNYGVYIHNGATLGATGSGTITLNGTGSAAGTTSNYGIRISASTPGTQLTSASGAISMTGIGGTDGDGLQVTNGAKVQSDTGAITLDGTTGDGGSTNDGVYLTGAGTLVTSGGNIGITGTSITTVGTGNRGVAVTSSAHVIATGAGTITMTGQGGYEGDGLHVHGGALVQSDTGLITLNGTSGDGTGTNWDWGVEMGDAGTLVTSGGGMTITGISTSTDSASNTHKNYGLLVRTGAKLTTSAGLMTLNGTKGAGTTSDAVRLSGTPAGGVVNAAAGLAINGTGDVVVDTGSVVNVGTGSADISATNSILFAASSSLAPSAGAFNITVHSDSDASGAGNIQMLPGSSIITNGGNIFMGGGADPLTNPATGFGTVGPFSHGILLQGATLNSGAGNISLIGKGASVTNTGEIGWGIVAYGGTTISASGGTIKLDGTAGAGPSDNRGVYMENAGTIIQSTNGDIFIFGTGGAGPYTTGIGIAGGAQIISTGTAKISLVGTCVGTLHFNTGVGLYDAGTTVQSVNGDITITGTSTGSGIQNYGVLLRNGAGIASTGSAVIAIEGTGASGNSGIFADFVSSSNSIGGSSATGPIRLTALTNDISLSAVTIQTSGSIRLVANNAGNITVNAGSEIYAGTASPSLFETSGSLNINGTVGAQSVVVNADSFTLSGGTWNQVSAALPGFTVNDFSITGGTFIRALGGDGVTTPYQLTDIYGVQGMGSSGMLGNSYVLANNIDAAGTANWNDAGGFAPVGNSLNRFTGQFDGSNHTIGNLTITRYFTDYVGLFGYIGTGGVVSKVGLVEGNIIGNSYVGGLAGRSQGSISYAYTTGVVRSNGGYVGGLVGYNDGSISNAYATGTVDGCYDGCRDFIGGLVGYLSSGEISNSHNTGSVSGGNYVGGLAGYNDSSSSSGAINNSYNTGSVSGNNYVGGLVGYNYYADYAIITGSYNTGSVSGVSYVGGLAGQNDDVITNSYSTGNVTGTGGYVGGLVGYNDYSGSISNAYATGNVDGSYLGGIDNVGGLVGYNNQGSMDNAYAVGSVSGRDRVGGLVGYSNYGFVRTSYATGNVSGGNRVGGLVGYNENDGGPSIANSYASGSVTGGNEVGGLVGYNYSTTISDSYSTGRVTGSSNAGGLVGDDNGFGFVTGSFWDTETSGKIASRGGIGMSTAQMKQLASFSGWAIANTGGANATWRIYEGSTTPLLTSFLKPVTVTANNASKTYDRIAFGGNGVTYSLPAATLSGTPGYGGAAAAALDVGSYAITVTGLYSDQQGYDISYAPGTLSISARPLTITAAGVSKVYDATNNATVHLGDNRVAGDLLTLGFGVASFNDKNVGSAKPVSVSGITLGGSAAGNYSFNTTASAAADITARALTVSASGVNKVYDGLLGATAILSDNRVAGDALTIGNGSAFYLDKKVGVAKTVNVSGITLTGTDAGNYAFNSTAATSADITARALTVSATGVNKVYDGLTGASVIYADNRVTGDVLGAGGSASFLDKKVGVAKTVNVSGITLTGTDAGNYTFNSTATTSADITPATLSLSGVSAANKVYDATTSATLSGGILSGVFGSDVVDVSGTGVFADKNVGTGKTVNLSAFTLTGTDAGNYVLSGTAASTTADITLRPLSTWIGGASGNWSVASNWDALPDLSNVQSVVVPAGTTVTYDAAAGGTNLASLTAGGLTLAGGSLNIADGLKVGSSFSLSGGTLGFGSAASADITQVSGSLTMPAATLANLALAAPAGAIAQSGAIVATDLKTQSQTGTTLTDAGNKVANFSAANSGSGNIAFTNTAVLTLGDISNSGGNINIDNSGAVTTIGAVSAPAGSVSILAHSPLTIGTGGVAAAGNITLSAGESPATSDQLTLNGAVQSTGSGSAITLFAGDDLAQNANVTANGGAVNATAQLGNISMALGTTTSAGGGNIGYTATSGSVILASLNAGSGGIALNAGKSIQAVPGFTGANLISRQAAIVAGGDLNLLTQVTKLDVDVGGKFTITDVLTGTVMSDVPAAEPLPTSSVPVLEQVLSTVTNTTEQQQPGQTTTQPPPPPPPPPAGGSGPNLLSSSSQTIGGTEGTFGGGAGASSSSGSSGAGGSGQGSGATSGTSGDKPPSDKPAGDKPSESKTDGDKSASAKTDEGKDGDKKDDKKEDDKKKKEEESTAKKDDKPAPKKLATCS